MCPRFRYRSKEPNYGYLSQEGDSVNKKMEVNCDGSDFLPCHLIAGLTKRSKVEKALRAAKVKDTSEISDFVSEKAQRTFLILMLMSEECSENVSLMEQFHKAGFADHMLPIEWIEKNGKWCAYSIEVVPPGDEAAPDSSKPLVELTKDQWGRQRKRLFEGYQWQVMAPKFGEKKFIFSFHNSTILPYVEKPLSSTSHGFFGEVAQYKVHPEHIAISGNNRGDPISVAVKKALNPDDFEAFFHKETENLDRIKNHKWDNLILPIAAYQRNTERCIVFPWASGGSLLKYWEDKDRERSDKDCSLWIIGQFTGICRALKDLHSINCRHGDLKPDNILWFKDGKDKHGTNKEELQIADLGLAAFHKDNTHIRRQGGIQTITPSGTRRYEPPETNEHRDTNEPRSRGYDIWSMGCILLELLIWLIYGNDAVKAFGIRTNFFWKSDGGVYAIHDVVRECMEALEIESQGHLAHAAVLNLVRQKLLVVHSRSTTAERLTADKVHEEMDGILTNCKGEGQYLVTFKGKLPLPRCLDNKDTRPGLHMRDGALAVADQNERPAKLPANKQDLQFDNVKLDRQATMSFKASNNSLQVETPGGQEQQSSKLNDDWEAFPDDDFAKEFLGLLEWDRIKPKTADGPNGLCSKCRTIQTTQLFPSSFDVSTLTPDCDLCGLLLNVLNQQDKRSGIVELQHVNATIGIKDGPNLLSIYVPPGPTVPEGAQLGLPELFRSGSCDQFVLINKWIETCNCSHAMCQPTSGKQPDHMPTRLICVQNPLRLVETIAVEPDEYAALSHCWGRLSQDERFCTSLTNIEQLKAGIDYNRLPKNFQDAVTVTVGLGIKYLWIDSICIIQDDRTDWEKEAARMEQVFSLAYFVIGASSAKSSLDGFLGDCPRRECVQIETQDAPLLYVCPFIDNFKHDVELGELNKRGWVFQERVLARRSIFFTSTQVYWECGTGVHCETLGRLRNYKAAFLGDANFPKSALEYYRDGRQMLIQDLYERYSSLAFTMPSDRAVAILGLQDRLAQAFETKAAYGFFEVYFARGLLWRRGQTHGLRRIKYPEGRHVPSWSWFSREGTIRYMDLKFKRIDWMTREFRNVFSNQKGPKIARGSSLRFPECASVLRGIAKMMDVTKEEMMADTIFDDDSDYEVEDVRCVIIGYDKTKYVLEDPKYHVLIITKGKDSAERECYERIGVASLRPTQVAETGSWVRIQ
ncbi:hypothetical protein NW768_011241 [Fusarium equiseti]|uniref:Protein kinase domain-containing protein n=1 Tax=Fusarium equiseti TaxID=61235 RepID=A0ABQ8QY81_FUSEQ|nr:hypothetical protein NW768_011241 [Fusarium equiseti]